MKYNGFKECIFNLRNKEKCGETGGTGLKSKIENSLIWESVFYQSEWVKINSSLVILVFSLCVCCC